MKVLALDPGQTTGWCVLETVPLVRPRDGAVFFGIEVLASGQNKTWHGWREFEQDVDAFVAERFALYRSHAAQLINSEFIASQVIGVVKSTAERRHKPCIIQPAGIIHASKGKINPYLTTIVDGLLPQSHAYKDRHVRDAAAHGAFALYHGKLKEEALKDARHTIEQERQRGHVAGLPADPHGGTTPGAE